MTDHRRRSPLHRGRGGGSRVAVPSATRPAASRLRGFALTVLVGALLVVAAVVMWVFDADWRWALVAVAALGLFAVFEGTRRKR